MAVNEKVHYATRHLTHGGKIFEPGERLSGRMDDGALKHAEASGYTTTSDAESERAKGAEEYRRTDVKRQQQNRSEKRAADERGQ